MTASQPVAILKPEPLRYAPEGEGDAWVIDTLVERAFGPGRFAKTAERLREGAELRRELSICAWDGDRLAGAVRQWSIVIGERPAVFLGPIAVNLETRSQGVGAALMSRAIDAAGRAGEAIILLVGDLAYFEQFGFEVARGPTLPGPVDPRRLLWKALRPDALAGVEGPVRPVRRR